MRRNIFKSQPHGSLANDSQARGVFPEIKTWFSGTAQCASEGFWKEESTGSWERSLIGSLGSLLFLARDWRSEMKFGDPIDQNVTSDNASHFGAFDAVVSSESEM